MQKNSSRFNRILSAILAVVLFFGVLPLSALSVDNAAVQQPSSHSVYVTLDGVRTESVDLLPHEKRTLWAQGAAEGAQYQWQILHPEQAELWVNIYDATGPELPVSLALVGNMLTAEGTAQLRCRATSGDVTAYSAPVTVTVLPEQPVTVAETFPLEGGENIRHLADGDGSSDFVTVTIEYWRYDYILQADGKTFALEEMGVAFSPYVATLKAETGLNTSVHCPTIVGYEPTLVRITEGSTSREPNITDDKSTTEFDAEEDNVYIRQNYITEDIVYRVEYRPAQVQYEVRYFFQNIYDDLYIEDSARVIASGLPKYPVTASGETGLRPDTTYTEREFDGFTSLYYEPETIAADGSTVFEVYYERNYYLMEFDCNGGYGTDTIYVRYGTHIAVPNPVKSGWVFAGWDLIATDEVGSGENLGTDADNDGIYDGDGTENPLPATMPCYNTAYKALWVEANTTYSVAYWIVNDDGTHSYLGGRIEEGTSNDTVSGSGDLATGAVCGELAHTHTDDCYLCSGSEHTHHTAHTIDCYNHGNASDVSDQDVAAIKEVEDNKPESGYIYVINASAANGDTRDWYKLFFDDGDGVVEKSDFYTGYSSEVDGESIKSKLASNNYKVTKYKSKTTCGMDICANICALPEHTHVSSCYIDTRYLEYRDDLTDKDVVLEGDGSSVVNVYYQYKKYTLKFYYAATTGGTDTDADGVVDTYDSVKIVGGSTYYFGRSYGTNTSDDATQLNKMFVDTASQCGEVEELPTLNDIGAARPYTKGSLPVDRNGDGTTDITYHYISFQARYGDNISGMWPCGVFNSAKRTNTNNASGWDGEYAFVSAWNGEHHVKYSQENGNETIKGVYEKLDDNLLFHTDYADESEVSYLCFWENGAPGVDWSVPELYIYNTWLPCIGNKEENAPAGKETRYEDNTWYYLGNTYNTCDDSSISTQTEPAITGYTFRVKKWNAHFISKVLLHTDGYYYMMNGGNIDKKYAETTVDGVNTGTVYSGRWESPQTMEITSSTVESTTYYLLYDKELYDPDAPGTIINHTLFREAYTVDFYYTANTHTLSFWNHDGYLTDGTGSKVVYSEPLYKYFEGITVNGTEYDGANDLIRDKSRYPSTLEPGAYEFRGWYTTAKCYPGTEVDWTDMTMPDESLMIYAKWEPVIRNVYFYYDYADYAASQDPNNAGTDYYWYGTDKDGNKVPASYPIEVKHGELVGSTYSNIPEAQEGYRFVGWFYLDEDNKKKFAPDSMEVKKDLHLFAEWQTEIDTQYNVTYVLDQESTIGGTTYPAGHEIAAPTSGHLTAGKTKTFTAKVEYELLADFQNAALFPTVNSHSILMETSADQNHFAFRYVYDDKVWYKVRYVDKITGLDLLPAKTQDSSKAIVTEKFVPISGYLPDDYYIRKVLAADGNEGTADNISPLNEIIFYYTPDTTHGLYVIEYYTPVLGATQDQLFDDKDMPILTLADGSANPAWHLEQSQLGKDDLVDENGDPTVITVDVDPNKFSGFSYDLSTITTYKQGSAQNEYVVDTEKSSTATTVSGQLTLGGLEIRVFYERNDYDYIVEYREYGAKETDAPLWQETFSAPFGSTVEWSLVEGTRDDRYLHITKDGVTNTYAYYDMTDPDPTKSIEIRSFEAGKDNPNKIIFYYNQKKVELRYHAVWKETLPAGESAGYVSISTETPGAAKPSGAEAFEEDGFRFVGWFKDEACTQAVDASWRYDPDSNTPSDTGTKLIPGTLYEDEDWINHYYALFVPVQEDLQIIKTGTDLGTDTFLFRVTGTNVLGQDVDLTVSVQGADSVTIRGLYCGDYTVTELTGWSWTYDCVQAVQTVKLTTKDKDTKGDLLDPQITLYQVTFTNSAKVVDWLHGESAAQENQFTIAAS